MSERLISLPRKDVQATMTRIEPKESYSDIIASELSGHVFDQPDAVKAVARRLALSETGLQEPTRPLASIYELGPTGTGKTEMAHAVSDYMFGDPHSDRLKIINMAEYQESHTTAKFVGAPQGYVGATEKGAIDHEWLHKGRSVIVFDEFEKANPTIQRLVLGILDKGTMSARSGQKGFEDLHFDQAVLLFTSNLGGREISQITEGQQRNIGFVNQDQGGKDEAIDQTARRSMKDFFAPEFIARLDDVVVFKPLERGSYARIFDKVIERRNDILSKTLNDQAPYFAATEEFKEHMLDKLNQAGGRELRRIMDQDLFAKAADLFASMDISGRPLVADIDDETGETVFYTDNVDILEPDSEMDAPVDDYIESERDLLPAPYDDPAEAVPNDNEPDDNDSEGIGDQRDRGDETDIQPPMRLGMEIRIFDESMVDEEGSVTFVTFQKRNIPLPR